MIWIQSDGHWGHKNIIGYTSRPFKTIEEMNEALINNWNSVVKSDDTIYCLGDFAFSLDVVKKISPRLLGRKTLIPGNHCPVFKFHKDCGWTDVLDEAIIKIGEYEVRLNHFPYQDKRYKTKHFDYQPKDDGRILCHGHLHSKKENRVRKSPSESLMIDCGVDCWDYKPVSEVELVELIKNNI